MIKITLKDGSIKEYDAPVSCEKVCADISEGLLRAATAAEIDGKTVDLRYVIDKDCNLNILTFDSLEGKKAYWHTTSHILAQAVKRLYPGAKLAIGPSIDNGFYYDFDYDEGFTNEDLCFQEKTLLKRYVLWKNPIRKNLFPSLTKGKKSAFTSREILPTFVQDLIFFPCQK